MTPGSAANVCPYYADGHCKAGGTDSGPCDWKPTDFENCFVYGFNKTGDISGLYRR